MVTANEEVRVGRHEAGRGRAASFVDDPLRSLLQRVSEGSEAALAALYDATSRRVFGLCLHIAKDREIAEETVIEVYAQAWRQATRYDAARGSVATWLLTLARARALDLLRLRERWRRREHELSVEHERPDSAPDPETSGLLAERARRVRDAVDALPVEQRIAVETAYFGGLSYADAASALNQPVGTFKARIRAAMSSLRARLARDQEDPR